MTPWWVERPGLLDDELAALRRRGIRFQVDEPSKSKGILRLDLFAEVNGEEIELTAVYPDLYPYFRPEVYAPGLNLERHQNPAGGNLCLIGRGTESWEVDQTLGDLVADQLPALLVAARRPAGTVSPVLEAAQGEPVTDYIRTQPNAVILFSDATPPADQTEGTLVLRVESNPEFTSDPLHPNVDAPILRGVLEEVRTTTGARLSRAEDALVGSVANSTQLLGRWIRLDRLPRPPTNADDLSAFVAEIVRLHPRLGDVRGAPSMRKHRVDVVGLLFPEEVGQDQWADSWVFLVRAYRGRSAEGRLYLASARRAGSEDLMARIPELRGLAGKSVAVVGLGGIGSTIALELARAQVGRLKLVDHDFVDPGAAVRWPFGLQHAGRSKVAVISDWIEANYPYSTVEAKSWRIGGVRPDGDGAADQDLLDELLDRTDLVIDATAEFGVHYLLATAARQRDVPYLEVSTRNGAWGGHLARIRQPACWLCCQTMLENLRKMSPPVVPAADPSPLRQPVGCADPTFTGNGFDVSEFSLIATRIAVGTLLGEAAGYPDVPWDLALIDLRTPDGVPRWRTYALEVADACPAGHEVAA